MVLESLAPLSFVVNTNNTKVVSFTVSCQYEGSLVTGKRQLMRIRFAFLP